MNIVKSKNDNITFIQVYLTKDELENMEAKEKINKLKNKNTRIAIFVSGEKNYMNILEKIIVSEVEKVNIWNSK